MACYGISGEEVEQFRDDKSGLGLEACRKPSYPENGYMPPVFEGDRFSPFESLNKRLFSGE
jgi:hypothetical protein